MLITRNLLKALASLKNGSIGKSRRSETGENVPFRAPWKKKRTTNTCSPAIDIIIRDSITLKLKIRRSVLRTVLKLRFSRVRKYFWLREIVDSWADSL